PASRLARRAIVGLVLGVDDPLDGLAARRAGLAVAPVRSHVAAEGGDTLGKFSASLSPEALDPIEECASRGLEETSDLLVREVAGELHGREPRPVQDLVRVRVADPAQDRGIGEEPLESVALAE